MDGIQIKSRLDGGRLLVFVILGNQAAVLDEAGALAIAKVLMLAVEDGRQLPDYRPSEDQPLVVDMNTGNLLNFSQPPTPPSWRQRLRRLFKRGAND